MYKVVYEKQARKGLATMQKKDRAVVIEKIKTLVPDPYKVSGVKKLKDRPAYRIRHRDWRAIFTINNEKVTILVIDINKRGKVYK